MKLTEEEKQKVREIRAFFNKKDEEWSNPPIGYIRRIFIKKNKGEWLDWILDMKNRGYNFYEMLLEVRMEEDFGKELKELDEIINKP